MKKYAVCMWGQLRSVDKIIENLYKNLLEPLEADFFVMVQKTGTDIDKNMDLLKTENKIGNDGSGYRTKATFIKRPEDQYDERIEQLYKIVIETKNWV